MLVAHAEPEPPQALLPQRARLDPERRAERCREIAAIGQDAALVDIGAAPGQRPCAERRDRVIVDALHDEGGSQDSRA